MSILEDHRHCCLTYLGKRSYAATHLPLVDNYIPRQSQNGRTGAVQWCPTPHISAIYEFMGNDVYRGIAGFLMGDDSLEVRWYEDRGKLPLHDVAIGHPL